MAEPRPGTALGVTRHSLALCLSTKRPKRRCLLAIWCSIPSPSPRFSERFVSYQAVGYKRGCTRGCVHPLLILWEICIDTIVWRRGRELNCRGLRRPFKASRLLRFKDLGKSLQKFLCRVGLTQK